MRRRRKRRRQQWKRKFLDPKPPTLLLPFAKLFRKVKQTPKEDSCHLQRPMSLYVRRKVTKKSKVSMAYRP